MTNSWRYNREESSARLLDSIAPRLVREDWIVNCYSPLSGELINHEQMKINTALLCRRREGRVFDGFGNREPGVVDYKFKLGPVASSITFVVSHCMYLSS